MAEAKVKRRGMWMKRVLIPLWTVQLLFMIILIGLTIFITVESYTSLPAFVIAFLNFVYRIEA